jgi:hypothetical protein
MTEQEQIQAFMIARGVKKYAPGVSTGLTQRDWRSKVRGEKTDAELIAERRIVYTDETGKELCVNGLGEPIYFG